MKRTGFKKKLLPARPRQPVAEMANAEPVHSTTARSPGEAQPKDGHLQSPVFLAFVRKLPCAFCHAHPPSMAHHHPPKGRGLTRDDKTAPVCSSCHSRAHGIPEAVNGLVRGPISEPLQEQAVDATFRLFADTASNAEWLQYSRERTRWFEGRRVEVVW